MKTFKYLKSIIYNFVFLTYSFIFNEPEKSGNIKMKDYGSKKITSGRP